MNLLTPWSLLIFLPLAAAIIFLYLLKLKRTPLVVSSVMLWSRLLADMQANAPFQKLRKNLLLFLQLLALLFLITALARPFVRARGFEGQSIVIVFDASASMKAADVSGARFGQAGRIARKAVDDLGRGDTMLLIAASAKTRVVSPFTSDKRTLAAAINALQCSDAATNLEDAIRLADSLCARKKAPQIVVLSDGAFPPLANRIESRARVSFIRFGARADNVAITALDARRALSGSPRNQVFVATENFSPRRKTFTVELHREGRLVGAREQTLAPAARGAEIFELPQSAGGLVTARLDARDDLAADNQASTFLTARRTSSALLITKGDLFLERALALDPALDTVMASSAPDTARKFDLVVVEGMDLPRLPRARGYLFINARGPQSPAEPGALVKTPTVVDWERAHPVTRYVNFSGLRVAQARVGALKPWGRALVETEAGPLLAAGERANARSLYLGWDLLQSDFPLRVAFPIFIANCVDWLTRAGAPQEHAALHPGEVLTLPVPARLTRARVTAPSGQRAWVAAGDGTITFENTDSAGIYTIEARGLRRRFVVNMLSRDESNTRPAAHVSLGGATVKGYRGSVKTNKELWRWLVILALAVATCEWIAYHRRP